MTLASIPSPTSNVWHLGPLPLRAYAICILLGVLAAVYIGDRRLRARGGPSGAMVDIAVWAVPFGIVGARIYHVLTTPGPYFGSDGHLIDVFKIWNGGLGIWGGIAGGALGAYIACRRRRLPMAVIADVAAPGLAVAQAIGRLGNWFNNELYGRETGLPWGLTVHVMDSSTGKAIGDLPGHYQPTFLYEILWCLGTAVFVVWAERRWQLGHGRVFALYAMTYTVGRAWIEALRIDDAEHIFGLRLNIWTSLVVFVGMLAFFLTRRGPREQLLTEEDGTVRVLNDPYSPHPSESRPDPDDDVADAVEPAGADETPPDSGDAEDADDPEPDHTDRSPRGSAS